MIKYPLLILIIVMILVALPISAYAIADPDSPPEVNAVYVYEDLLADGDVGVLIDYYLDYSCNATPDEMATEAYLAIFIDTDGATQLKSVAPYTFQCSGYQRGLIWIYFTPTEVVAYNISSDNVALYDIWLIGNPTLSWAGDPPQTIASIDYWQPEDSSTATLLALRVLYLADQLELAWSLDMVTETALGSRFTALGESYFLNVIPNLRTMAPSAFSSGEFDPTMEDLDYSTAFGATMTNGTGVVVGSPITLTEGCNTVNVTTVGTFTLGLTKGTTGNVTDGTGTVTGSPVDLVYGTNTITVTGAGTFVVCVNLQDTQSKLTDAVSGTGLDLTDAAVAFGMTRWMFSGLVWLIMSVIICAAVYKVSDQGVGNLGSGKIVLLVFDICIIGGTVLGLMHPIVGALIFIGFIAFTGYVLFFKGANV